MGREGIGRARAALRDAVKLDRDSYAGEILRLAAHELLLLLCSKEPEESQGVSIGLHFGHDRRRD